MLDRVKTNEKVQKWPGGLKMYLDQFFILRRQIMVEHH